MWKIVTDIVTSKKALAAIAGVIIAATNSRGLNLPEEAVNQILAAVVAYVIGQGLADFGKAAKA